MLQKLKSLLFKIFASLALLSLIAFNTNIKDHYYRSNIGNNVVRIYNMEKTGSGTGFHIKDGFGNIFILTNKHVCAVADENGQLLVEKNGIEIPRKVIEVYVNHDLCLVEAMTDHEDYIDIADSVSIGEDITIIGHPGGRDLTLSHGEFVGQKTIHLQENATSDEDCSKKGGVVQDAIFMKVCVKPFISSGISAISYGGNSGSPVVDKFGNVVGVLFAGSSQVTDSYMVPLRYIKDFLKGHVNE